MNRGEHLDFEDLTLNDLLSVGSDQTGNLTYYKLVFNAFDQMAREHAGDDEVYRRSLLRLVAGFLAGLRPEFLPQAVAAKNLLLKKVVF